MRKSKSLYTQESVSDLLRSQNIVLRCPSELGMVDESPDSYKDAGSC